jgi:ABC-type dipeptide/oligopeptide/nickel transport system ATPase component
VSGPAISVRNIARDFQAGQQLIRVLHGIDLDVRPGELTYLVGESGCATSASSSSNIISSRPSMPQAMPRCH